MEWGALWIREWRDGITHIIVDKGLCYNDVLKTLKLTLLSVSTPTLGMPEYHTDQTV